MSEDREKKIRIQVDRSAEVEALQRDLEDQQQINSNKEIEVAELRDTLKTIANKELSAKLEVLAKEGYDISGIISEQDPSTKMEKFKELEYIAKTEKQMEAPRGGETSSVFQNQNPPSRRQLEIDEMVNQAIINNGVPIESISFDSLNQMKDTLRKIALDSSDSRSAKAKEVLNEWIDKGTKRSFELEYQGKLTEYGKSAKIRRKGEWKIVKGDKEK